MTTLTNDQKIVNCLLALCNWHDVLPMSVNLEMWKCGTQACFGGHLTTWPEFQAMGIAADCVGGPIMAAYFSPDKISQALFGGRYLFSYKGGCETDCLPRSDHATIVNRLEAQIEKLS